MSLADIVNLQISRTAPAVSRAGFGTMLILGPTTPTGWSSDRIRTYTSAAAVLADGFTTSDPEYKAAQRAFGQAVQPQSIKIGRRLTAVAQVDTMTPNVTTQSIQHFICTINGTAFDFTSDITPTAAEVVTGLIALINAGSEPVTASGTNTLILTADQAGIPFTATGNSLLANVHTTANVGVTTDLATISGIDDDWYALALTSTDVEEIFITAAYIETVRKIYIAQSGSSAIIAAGSTDIASRLVAASYSRTALIYSADTANQPAAAWLGRCLPLQPGSVTYKFKTLAGITVDALSATAYGVAKGKKANVYTSVGGLGITEEGVMANGYFIDDVIGIDWIHVNMSADVYQALVDNDKIPYTDDGVAMMVNIIQKTLTLAVTRKILTNDPAPVVTAPLVADIATGDRATRTLPDIDWSAYLAGAIHSLNPITGKIAV